MVDIESPPKNILAYSAVKIILNINFSFLAQMSGLTKHSHQDYKGQMASNINASKPEKHKMTTTVVAVKSIRYNVP